MRPCFSTPSHSFPLLPHEFPLLSHSFGARYASFGARCAPPSPLLSAHFMTHSHSFPTPSGHFTPGFGARQASWMMRYARFGARCAPPLLLPTPFQRFPLPFHSSGARCASFETRYIPLFPLLPTPSPTPFHSSPSPGARDVTFQHISGHE